MVVEKPEEVATQYLLICFFVAEIKLINIYSLLDLPQGCSILACRKVAELYEMCSPLSTSFA